MAKRSAKHRPTPAARAVAAPATMPRWIWWFAVCLTVFVALPDMMSAHFTPKTFWASCSVAAGLVFCRLRAGAPRLTALGAAWAGLLGWALLSLAWAPSPRVGLERWCALLALPTLGYFLALRTRFWLSTRFWTAYAAVFAVFSLIGILQFVFTERQFPLVHIFPGTAPPRATVGHRNYAALYLVVTIPMLAAAALRARGRLRVFFVSAIFIGMLLILLTRGRQAWIAMIVSACFMASTGVFRLRRLELFDMQTAVTAALLALLTASVLTPTAKIEGWMGSNKKTFWQTIKSISEERNDNPRIGMWDFTLGVPINRLVGCGLGNFPVVATPVSRENAIYSLDWEVHNDYIQTLVDLGAVGAGLLLVFYGGGLWLAWRRRPHPMRAGAGAALTGLAVIQCFDFTSQKVETLMWMAGVFAVLNAAPGRRGRPLTIQPWMSRAACGAAVLGLASLACAAAGAIHGDHLIWKDSHTARLHREQRDYNHLAQDVVPWLVFDAAMAHQAMDWLAADAYRDKFPAAAVTFAEKGLALHPTDNKLMMIEAEIAAAKGDDNTAREIYERIVAQVGPQPGAAFVYKLLRLYERVGEKAKAAELRARARDAEVSAPSGPEPANMAAPADSVMTLSWAPGRNADSYNLWFWAEGEEKPAGPAYFNLREPRAKPDRKLMPGVTYFWRVEASGPLQTVRGKIWAFQMKPDENWPGTADKSAP